MSPIDSNPAGAFFQWERPPSVLPPPGRDRRGTVVALLLAGVVVLAVGLVTAGPALPSGTPEVADERGRAP